MSLRVPPSRTVARLDRTAVFCILLLPLLLLHAHGVAEVAIAVADLCFLGWCALEDQWTWLRTRWVWLAGAWWLWLVICSTPVPALGLGEGGRHSLIQALATLRFLLVVAAMEHLALRTESARDWLYGLVAASALWIGLNCLIQEATGYNLIGWPRGGDGELTGPFGTPRAGPALSRILLPAILPPVADLLAERRWLATAAAYGLLLLGLAVMVLISQRMPLLLIVFGLLIVAGLVRQLRMPVLAAAVASGVLLAASPVVAPAAYFRLVEKFSSQMEHFATSQYGELYARAWEVGRRNPITGLGFDGFGTGCAQPKYFRPSFDGSEPTGGGAKICWVHPHNTYLQMLDDGGFIGLALFCATAVAWLMALGRGLLRDQSPLRVGLFATVFVLLWPVQSTSAFTSMPIGGWFFLLLGWGMAEARFARPGTMVV